MQHKRCNALEEKMQLVLAAKAQPKRSQSTASLVWSLEWKAALSGIFWPFFPSLRALHLRLGYNLLAIADHRICLLQVTGSYN